MIQMIRFQLLSRLSIVAHIFTRLAHTMICYARTFDRSHLRNRFYEFAFISFIFFTFKKELLN